MTETEQDRTQKNITFITYKAQIADWYGTQIASKGRIIVIQT